MPPRLEWRFVTVQMVLLAGPAQPRGAGSRTETDAQTVGLIVLGAVIVITAVHATIMIVRHLTGRHAAPAQGLRRTIRVWDLGVRVSHWSIVASIAVLVVTGYVLAHPVPSQGRGGGNPTMHTVRSVHVFFAVVFTAAVLFRICWFFAGNRWASWRYWIPTTRARLRRLREQAAYYAFIRRTPPAEIGHNPLAGAAYTVLYLILAAQILTGFALYSQGFEGGFWPGAFGWLLTLYGEPGVRFTHGVVMWVLLAFVIHHVYSSILIGAEEHSGMVAGIITGNKSFTEEHLPAADEHSPAETPQPSQ